MRQVSGSRFQVRNFLGIKEWPTLMKNDSIKTISMKSPPALDGQWVCSVIASDPSILGLGKLEMIDKGCAPVSSDRLDLLLGEMTGMARYEAELQLGATNPAHIIQTIEYWGKERRLNPRHEHVGVLIAQEFSPRFLSIINLFNDFIPLIALQMRAIDAGNGITLEFTKIVDSMHLGVVTEVEMDFSRFQEQFELSH